MKFKDHHLIVDHPQIKIKLKRKNSMKDVKKKLDKKIHEYEWGLIRRYKYELQSSWKDRIKGK